MGDDNNKPGEPGSAQPGTMTLEQYQAANGGQVQVSMAISQATLPNLAPAPQHTMAMGHPGQLQPGQPAGGQPVISSMTMQPGMGQPMTMGQPQYQVVQPQQFQFPAQYATMNQQGQLMFQSASPFQPGQMIVLPQTAQPGKPNWNRWRIWPATP